MCHFSPAVSSIDYLDLRLIAKTAHYLPATQRHHDSPKLRLSELVNSLKGVSSQRLQQEFPAIKTFWSVRKSPGVLWVALRCRRLKPDSPHAAKTYGHPCQTGTGSNSGATEAGKIK
jgi:hypothetical protein